MKEIYTEIEINASTRVVWGILNEFENFPKWNPFIQEISGNQQEGSQIDVFIKPPHSNGMRLKPTILIYKPEKELRWFGRLWIPKLFDGEHSFILRNLNDNKTLFIQKERFNGILILFFSSLLKDTESGFKLMNKALKNISENKNSK
jgi:hypothetical protein